MKKTFFRFLVLAFTTALTACNSDELVVTLEIEDDLAIEKVTLHSSYGPFTESISRNEIGDKKTIILKCPLKGEGTFSICVFTKDDTLCSKESYVEGGYRPKLKLKDHQFETMESF